MNKWKTILLYFFVIGFQKVVSIIYGTEQINRANFVLSGVPICGDIRITCSKLILWYLPISVLFFVCSGRAKELTDGYAIMQITRGEKRGKIVGNKLYILVVEAICLHFVNIFVMQDDTMKWNVFLVAFLLNTFTILFFLFLEFLLELSLDSMVSVCITQLLFIILIFLGDILSGSIFEKISHYILLPCFAFAERNGVYKWNTLMIILEIGILILGICVELFLIKKKYRRQDLI